MTKRRMFIRMITASLLRRRSRMLIALLSIGIGATILAGMVTIYYDVPRQMRAQMRSYGANMLLMPGDGETLDSEKLARTLTQFPEEALVGFAAGYFMGFGFAQLIGHSVFGSAIDMDTRVIPIVAGLIALVTIAGSLPAIRMVLRLRPAEVLHGGH